jgi:glutamate---cysteine ligase / carboxylate-amine ligase
MRPSTRADENAARGLRAFDGYGLELEYMIVKRDSLDGAPIADVVLQRASGAEEPVNEFARGALGWSNELVLHVLELKNLAPTAALDALAPLLHEEVLAMNRLLAGFGARLMPGGMHPWVDPRRETQLWPHGGSEIYRAYARVFGCCSHGWANLQSTHINLPFSNDEEFARLHAAVRVVLPIMPALNASSPYADGRAQGALDYRMEAYRTNAEAVPEMNGEIVPEPVSSRAQYERDVLQPLYRAVAPHDPEGVLQHEWLNARGAIPRFDRGALEIRVADAQETPQADLAHATVIIDLVQWLYERRFSAGRVGQQLPTRTLAEIFRACVHDAERARIRDSDFLALFGMRSPTCDAGALWCAIAEALDRAGSPHAPLWREAMEYTLARGPLARRLLRATGPRPDRATLHELYAALCEALEAGKRFDP